MAALIAEADRPAKPLGKARGRTKPVNTPASDVRAALYGMLGVDPTQIHGLGPSLALKLVGEWGRDLNAWPSAKHFTSWLCLAPGNKISGGKVLSSRTRRSSSRAAALLRLAATTVSRTDTALGAFYRRLSLRAGKSKAVTAAARKIAVLFYNVLRHGMESTTTRAQITMKNVVGRASSSIYAVALSLWASTCTPTRKAASLFLRKAWVFRSPEVVPARRVDPRLVGVVPRGGHRRRAQRQSTQRVPHHPEARSSSARGARRAASAERKPAAGPRRLSPPTMAARPVAPRPAPLLNVSARAARSQNRGRKSC
jgi:hypothetical protein